MAQPGSKPKKIQSKIQDFLTDSNNDTTTKTKTKSSKKKSSKQDMKKLTLAELKEKLIAYELPVKGTKDELLARLEYAQENEDRLKDSLSELNQLKVPELKRKLTEYGLPVCGTKVELQARLKNAIKTEDGPPCDGWPYFHQGIFHNSAICKLCEDGFFLTATHGRLKKHLKEKHSLYERYPPKELTQLQVPELKRQLKEYGLPVGGSKVELQARLESAVKNGPPCEPSKKKQKTSDDDIGISLDDLADWPDEIADRIRGVIENASRARLPKCVKTCVEAEQSGCAHQMFKKPKQGRFQSCYEVDRLIEAMGMDPNKAISKCTKAAIMLGHIKVDGKRGELNKVIREERSEYCGHMIRAKLVDLLIQPDYGGHDYEVGLQDATVMCKVKDCEEGRVYVSGLCHGSPAFDCGKFHNHCVRCPGFGSCIYDYREGHCTECGTHIHRGGMCWPYCSYEEGMVVQGPNGCYNDKCSFYKPDEFS